MSEKIIIVDDDLVVCEIIRLYLTSENYEVTIVHNGYSALKMIRDNCYDLVLLDIVLPDIDGNEVARQIRQHSQLPILMISSRSSEVDKVKGLGVGGDDYITKPISPIEMLARVKAHLRRYRQYNSSVSVPPSSPASIRKVGPLSVDLENRKVFIDDNEITLTSKEYNLLRVLIINSGRVLTKDQLFNLVWGDEFFDDNTLMVAIRRLRSKIEKDPSKPRLLHNVWGAGYRLEWK